MGEIGKVYPLVVMNGAWSKRHIIIMVYMLVHGFWRGPLDCHITIHMLNSYFKAAMQHVVFFLSSLLLNDHHLIRFFPVAQW